MKKSSREMKMLSAVDSIESTLIELLKSGVSIEVNNKINECLWEILYINKLYSE